MSLRYSYSKTRGLFGGVSVEGSVIVERQDANSMAYKSDVTAKQLLSGSIDPPEWTSSLIKTLESCTGMPGNRKWINDGNNDFRSSYAFGGVSSPGNENKPSSKSGKKKKAASSPFPPPSWGQKKESGSYFESEFPDDFGSSAPAPKPWDTSLGADTFYTAKFGTHFESDFSPDKPQTRPNPHVGLSLSQGSTAIDDPKSLPPFDFARSSFSPGSTTHSRSMSVASPFSHAKPSSTNPFAPDGGHQRSLSLAQSQYIAPKPELTVPLSPKDGVARAIALYNFQAVEVRIFTYYLINLIDHIVTYVLFGRQAGDLSFSKGEVIIVTQKSDSSDDW
jgi:SH3 domain-containing YSC84-like protein 1